MPNRRRTPNQEAFEKQIRRLQRALRAADLKEISLRDLGIVKPERVTKKKIEELRSIKPRMIVGYVEDVASGAGYVPKGIKDVEKYINKVKKGRRGSAFPIRRRPIKPASAPVEYEDTSSMPTQGTPISTPTADFENLEGYTVVLDEMFRRIEAFRSAMQGNELALSRADRLENFLNNKIDEFKAKYGDIEGMRKLGGALNAAASQALHDTDVILYSSMQAEVDASFIDLSRVIYNRELTPDEASEFGMTGKVS